MKMPLLTITILSMLLPSLVTAADPDDARLKAKPEDWDSVSGFGSTATASTALAAGRFGDSAA